MNVLFVAPSLGEASARLRILSALPGLAAVGIQAQALELPRRSRARWAFIRNLRRADAVVLHRKLFGFLEFAFLRRNCRVLLFDFDDAVLYRDPFRKTAHSRRRAGRFANTVAKVDAVVAGNDYLRERALESGASAEVRVIPTAVDLSRYASKPPTRAEGTVLGWIGQASTLPYLEDILPALDGLGRDDPRYRLRVIADAFPETAHLRLERRPWSEDEEALHLMGIDIGLMPLRDDVWSRGKCGYKILQYFAAGKPVVASPVGINTDLVRPGATGFLAATPKEWADSIAALACDPALGEEMGRNGKALIVSEGFIIEEYVRHLVAFLRDFS